MVRAGASRAHDYWVASRQSPQFWGLFEAPGEDAWWMGRQSQFWIDPLRWDRCSLYEERTLAKCIGLLLRSA